MALLKILFVFYIGFKIGNAIHKSFYIRFICAISLAFLFYKFSFSPQFLTFSFFTGILILVSVEDYFHKLIPAIAPPLLFGIGLLFSFFNPIFLDKSCFFKLLNSILGALAGGGILFLIGMIGEFLYKKEVMGGGDVKLMLGVGTFVGADRVLLSIFIASFLASIVGLILILFKKKSKEMYIPFGPFLSLASVAVVFIPKPIQLFDMFFAWEAKILGV
ncbi:MAG: A24 family peptidase [Endomicrobium sp.]|jgi:leader peptidase (prepilin peptidase)/N-methyltransferase|nr:A24 family peptidase [Endomicrobium sp.]